MVSLNSKAIIYLSKIEHNLNAIKRRLNKGVQVMAVVKNNAYGHGILPISRHIKEQVDWFCVAWASEGKLLREAGIKNPILVFEAPLEQTTFLYTEFGLTATLAEIDSLKILRPGTEYHINIDTGMHRLGVLPDYVSELKREMTKYPELTCTGIYTHLFKADDPGNSEVKEQLNLFKSIRVEFVEQLITHTANTGGIFHYGDLDLHYDAVRPGVCLYGYGAGQTVVPDLEPILDWKSSLVQVKTVKKGEPVSYGAKWFAPQDGFIGVIPMGYSSGIPRCLSNSIKLGIADKLYNQVGVISMDYSIVFLGKDRYKKGQEVYFLKGKELSAKHWADKAGTIPYEITTSIKEHVNRAFAD